MVARTPIPLAAALAVLTLLSLAPVSPVQAQLGVRGGVNLTDFFGDDVGETDRATNLSYGLSLRLIRLGAVEIVAEGYYGKKGAGWDLADVLTNGGAVGLDSAQVSDLAAGASTGVVEFGLDYVEVPVMLRINLPLQANGRIRPYIQGGPAFGWQIDCGIEVDLGGASGQNASCEDLQEENIRETIRDYEMGAAFGGGFDVRVLGGAGAITLDARFVQGLSRLQEDGNDVRNRSFALFLGYSFGFY